MTILAPPPYEGPLPDPPAAERRRDREGPTPNRVDRQRPSGSEGLGNAVDLALFGVTAAVAVSLVRAFRTWDELWPLLLVVALAHGFAWIGRALRIGAFVATLALLGLGAVVITLVYYRTQSWYGLPSPSVFEHALSDARTAFGPFQDLVAPVDALPGFTVTFAAGLWLIAVFADLAAGRSDAPLQAVTPHAATFVFSSVLLLGRHAILATGLFVGAMVVYRMAVRAARLRRDAGNDAGRSAVWTVGLPMLVVVLLAGTVFSKAAPTERGGMVDLRSIGRGPDPRVVESPLVSLDSLLGEESQAILFKVVSPTPHYWRLTALDDFDGRSWSASAKYADLDSGEEIASSWGDAVDIAEERIEVSVGDLQSDWLPSVYAPRSVQADIGLRYDRDSASIFVVDGESTSNLDYSMVAEVADVDRAVLQKASSAVDRRLDDFLALPANFSERAEQEAQALTANLGAYDSALALEKYFRSSRFTYDRTANYRDQVDPLAAFLDNGRGFCQQFATAFASMARSIGLPSRVAVGFTYGDAETTVDPDTGEERTEWTVRGRYAHAWPEVFINGVGWVAFEPTPGRGNPDAESYSDVRASQSDDRGGSVEFGATTTTTTTTTTPTNGVVPTTLPEQLPPRVGETPTGTTPEETSNTPTIVLISIVAAVLAVFVAIRLRVAAMRRRRVRTRRPEVSTGDRVEASWLQACRDLARVDVRARASETPMEFARRASKVVEVEDLVTLGHRESDRRFRAAPPDEQEAESAERISDEIRDVVWSRLDRQQRLRADLDVGGRSD